MCLWDGEEGSTTGFSFAWRHSLLNRTTDVKTILDSTNPPGPCCKQRDLAHLNLESVFMYRRAVRMPRALIDLHSFETSAMDFCRVCPGRFLCRAFFAAVCELLCVCGQPMCVSILMPSKPPKIMCLVSLGDTAIEVGAFVCVEPGSSS